MRWAARPSSRCTALPAVSRRPTSSTSPPASRSSWTAPATALTWMGWPFPAVTNPVKQPLLAALFEADFSRLLSFTGEHAGALVGAVRHPMHRGRRPYGAAGAVRQAFLPALLSAIQ